MTHRNNQGFTLLELMIALAIFAVTAMVILEQCSASVRQQSRLEEKTLAIWLAENQLEKLQHEQLWPSLGRQNKKSTFASREWYLQQTTSQTSQPHLRKIAISVALKSQNATPVVTLTGYIGELL